MGGKPYWPCISRLRARRISWRSKPGACSRPGGYESLAEAAAVVAGGSDPELTTPADDEELSAVRVWFSLNPTLRDGAELRLRIESDEALSDVWEHIIRATFTDEARVRLRRLTGGYMASTYAAETADRQGRRTLPSVLKITPKAVAAREEAAHWQFVRPFILNNATILFAQAAYGEYAGLRYNFVGITGAHAQLQTQESLYLSEAFPEALTALRQTFTDVLEPVVWAGGGLRKSGPSPATIPGFFSRDCRRMAHEGLGINPNEPRLGLSAARSRFAESVLFPAPSLGCAFASDGRRGRPPLPMAI